MRPIAALLLAVGTGAAAETFAAWWPQFQAAVAKNDAHAIVEGAAFPMQWENGPVREIKTREDFLARFDTYFTADMKRAVARQKPVPVPEGYMITWKARGNEYSFYFRGSGARFALAGLSEGPP